MLLLTNKTIEKLKYDLVREKFIDYDALQRAQESAEIKKTALSDELVSLGIISEKDLLAFIENKLHIPFVELSDYNPDKNSLQYISVENAQKFNIFPLFKIEDVLTIAMSDPLDLFTINTLFELSEISIEPVIASEKAIKNAIAKYYLSSQNVSGNNDWMDMLISDNLSDESLQQIINGIFIEAIATAVSSVSFERTADGIRLFFDKELKAYIPSILVPRFVFELKTMANFDIEIDDVPQSSKFLYNFGDEEYSILASVFPTKYSQRFMFLINKPLKPLAAFGFDLDKISVLFSQPGLIALNTADSALNYSLAEYLSEKYSVLMVEAFSKYEVNNAAQIEFQKNSALYFDEIMKQVDLQNFEVIFWEQIYSKEQLDKLKLLAKSKIIIISNIVSDLYNEIEYKLNFDGSIE